MALPERHHLGLRLRPDVGELRFSGTPHAGRLHLASREPVRALAAGAASVIWHKGREWGTAAQLAERLGGDVTAAMVRRWRDRKGLTTHAGLSPLDEAATIELATRTSTRGRPRRLDAAPIPA